MGVGRPHPKSVDRLIDTINLRTPTPDWPRVRPTKELKWAYYNDNDPYIVAWVKNLIKAGLVPEGVVDDRSIADVQAEDVADFMQVHLFCGILGWPLGLQMAGWPEDRPVWTASCPCQSLSNAGKRKGADDERHLWPELYRLLAQCRPAVCFGEQVAGPLGRSWFAAVRADLEHLGDAVGGSDLPAAGVGAPHIRQRLFWVSESGSRDDPVGLADGRSARRRQDAGSSSRDEGSDGQVEEGDHLSAGDGADHSSRGLEDAGYREEQRRPAIEPGGRDAPGGARTHDQPGRPGDSGRMGHGNKQGPQGRCERPRTGRGQRALGPTGPAHRMGDREHPAGARLGHHGLSLESEQEAGRPGYATHWSDVVFVLCADGKARPVEPGIFPLADGLPGRVGQLRGSGNAIVPEEAAEFIRAYMDCRP